MYLGKKRGKIGREMESLSQIMDFIIVRGSAKRIIIILAVFLALLCLSTTALGVGSISGRVFKHSDDSPLQGVWVQLHQGVDENIADEHAWDYVAGIQTDGIGYYQFTGLEPRRYRVNIYSQNVGGTHYAETDLYNIQVFEGIETPNMDLKLRQAGLIYGYVKTTGNIPISNAEVITEAAWTQDGRDWHSAWTNQEGRYELWVLPSPGKFYPVWVRRAMLPGTTYKVYGGNTYISGVDGYHPENYGYTLLGTGTATQIFNDPSTYNYYIIVTEDGYVAKVDAVQGSNNSYYGTWNSGNTSDYWNVSNAPSEPDGQFASVGASQGWGYSGGYIFIDPIAGNSSLKVYIVPDGRGADPASYESKWNDNFYKATTSGTQVPDYKLELGGMVTGRVVNESDVGIGGVRVEGAWSKYGDSVEPWVDTGSDGHFTLSGLPPGTNYICLNNDWREIKQDNVKYMVGEAYAGPLNISSGQTINLNEPFTIYKAGRVTGVVTDKSGNPIVGVEMRLEGRDIDGNEVWKEEVVTGALGQFTLDYVAPGIYVLTCRKEGFILASEFNLRVNRSETVDNVDFVMKNAAEGATISGKIANYSEVIARDSDGVQFPTYGYHGDFLISGFGLIALPMDKTFTDEDYLDIDTLFVGDMEEVDIDDGYDDYFVPDASPTPGNYTLCLPSGDISVGMYIYQDFLPGEGGCAILHDWKRYNFAKGDVIGNVDFTAVTTNTGTLKGDIKAPAGYHFPSDWCSIYAYALDDQNHIKDDNPDGVAFSGWTTQYEFRNMPAGKYMLTAYARYLPSVVIPLVTVSSGTTTEDIDFTSAPSGTLTGQVTSGTPVEGATVTIVENGRQAVTDSSGNYTITGINTGTYTVKVTVLGYADAQATVIIDTGSNALNFSLNPQVGSISGTVKDAGSINVNGATVVAYNESNNTHKTTETVAGEFTIAGLTYGQYILAVDTEVYGVVVHPSDGSRITLDQNNDDITGIPIVVGELEPPLFTVTSSVSNDTPPVLSMEFYSDQGLNAAPAVSIVPGQGDGSLGTLTSNSALNRFNIDYTAVASDNLVVIRIAETNPLVPGNAASKDFAFEVGENLVMTSSTNVTNATGGSTSIMGTQDNTEIYVPPFAIAGADDTQAVALIIERYGDPGDAVTGTSDSTVSAVYDFKFDETGVSIDENHTFTVTMSFQLPSGMTEEEFENTLELRYFHVGDQVWKTDGISNVRINWTNYTIMFEVSHLSKFAAFTVTEAGSYHTADENSDYVIDDFELLDYIDLWKEGLVGDFELLDTIELWKAGRYYWDESGQKFMPGEQP